MKITQRMLSVTIIVLVFFIILFGFSWANCEVSYKYEVQDTMFAGKQLDPHQKDILYYITSSKIELVCSFILLVFVLYLNAAEPTFKGRVYYASKKPSAP
jgi:hypothetical protein